MKVMLDLTSIHDLLNSIDDMATYDRLLAELSITEFDQFEDEDFVTYATLVNSKIEDYTAANTNLHNHHLPF